MPLNNIIKCANCNAPLIAEEFLAHECFSKAIKAIQGDTEGRLYAFDGKHWYRWFPSANGNSTTGNNNRRFNRTTFVVSTTFQVSL